MEYVLYYGLRLAYLTTLGLLKHTESCAVVPTDTRVVAASEGSSQGDWCP